MHRHHATLGLLYVLARRAQVRPELERAGLLTDLGVFLELRRLADVLVQLARDPAGGGLQGPVESVALDVKVVNACGADHWQAGPEPAVHALTM